MKSIVKEIGTVTFPVHTMERAYMREFRKETGVPNDLKRWQPTIDQILAEVDTDGPIYLMIDQGFVKANQSHRRPGIHIDGYWIPELQTHSGGGGHIHNTSGRWDTPSPSWIHAKNRGYWDGDYWNTNPKALDWPDEAIILASDVQASKAYVGEWNGEIKEGGDCSHLDVSHLKAVDLKPNIVYAGNVTMLHESTPVLVDSLRTLVRLSVPGWSPKE